MRWRSKAFAVSLTKYYSRLLHLPRNLCVNSGIAALIKMEIKELVTKISQKHKKQGIKVYSPASNKEILVFEKKIGFPLPPDFIEFYSLCNGFACTEDIFNITPLYEISDRGKNWFLFAEYMIVSDSWGLRFIGDTKYEIFYSSYGKKAITGSLNEFLERFLRGNVFEDGGLYDWMEELGIR